MLGLAVFYLLFSVAFLFFQQPKNLSDPANAVRNLSFGSLPVISLSFNPKSVASHVSTFGTGAVHRIYHPRQRYDLGARNTFSALVLFPVFLLFALFLPFHLKESLPLTSRHDIILSFPKFLSVTSLRI